MASSTPSEYKRFNPDESIARRIAIACRPVTNRFTYTVRSGVAAGLKRRGGLGFLWRAATIEEKFVRALDLAGKVVYEVGSFEGIYTIYFASQADRVIAFEPHPQNRRTTLANVRLNKLEDRVTVQPVALGAAPGNAVLTSPKGETARASLDPAISASIRREGRGVDSVTVDVMPLDSYGYLPPPDFLKIDAEGAEYDILLGSQETLRRHPPAILIEIHGAGGDAMANARRIASLLESSGYSLKHVEDDQPVDSRTALGNLGHIYAVHG